MARWLIFLALITGVLCQDDLILEPVDTTVEAGGRAVIQCKVNAEKNADYALAWQRTIGKDREQIYIYSKSTGAGTLNFPEEHEIEETEEGLHNLVIKDAKLVDGGRYACELIFPNSVSREVSLVVIETPSITSGLEFLENTSAEIKCEGRFGSPPEGFNFNPEHQPFLRGYVGGKILDDVRSTVDYGVPGVSTGKASYHANITVSGNMDKKMFLCEFRTEMPYFYVKKEEAIEVHYAVNNIEIIGEKATFYPGESINCSANGNPEPELSWSARLSGGSRPVTGTTLQILNTMIGENVWECRARNHPTGANDPTIITKTFSFTVEALPTDPPNTKDAGSNVVVIVVVCIIALLIIVGAAIGFYCFKRKKGYDPRKEQKAVNLESDIGDLDDTEDEDAWKTQESKEMMPPPINTKVRFPEDPEKTPLRMMPLKSGDIENGRKSIPGHVRNSDVPPTPPPPMDEAVLQSLLDGQSQPKKPAGSKRVLPPGGKPVLPPDVKSQQQPGPSGERRKPTPRSRSKENLADLPKARTRSKENLTDDGTSV